MFFSIIIPIYNAEKNLVYCLESIQRQTYNNFEVILVDDGSKDNSGFICDDYMKKYENFRVIHKRNAGVAAARNTAILNARGDYLVFVDSDDFLSDDYLESIHSLAKKDYPDIIVNSSYYIYAESESRQYNFKIHELSSISAMDMQTLLIDREYPSGLPMSVYKRDLLLSHNLDESIHFYEDLDFQLGLVGNVEHIIINYHPGYFYRMGSDTHSSFNQKTITCYKIIDKLKNRGVNQCLVDRLEGEFVISNALIAAHDRSKHCELDSILHKRARRLRKTNGVKNNKSLRGWIRLIAVHPQLFYLFYRIKHRR